MKKVDIAIGTRRVSFDMPEAWEELTAEQYVYAVAHAPRSGYLPIAAMRHILGIAYEDDLFVMPVHWLALYDAGFNFLDDTRLIRTWCLDEIVLSDGRRCLPPSPDFDNVTWEEFVFADELAHAGNWAAVAACLYRPADPSASEESDGRIPFSRFGVSNRLHLFQELSPSMLAAVDVNYCALFRHVADRYRYLFTPDDPDAPKKSEHRSPGWLATSQALLGDTVWHEEQLLHTSVGQVLFHLNGQVKLSINKK